MPRVPASSPATGNKTGPAFIHTTACNFVDNAGRTLLLRGVNLSGSSKAPVGRPSYLLEGFWENAEAGEENFIGRPLDLDDGSADVHLARLRGWGFNMLRFPITWEALEHAGPGKYDYEYMDYTIRVLEKCRAYGFKVYLDPHQDVWSRFSGGSGAPFWTLAACGINPRNLTATQAAIVHCEFPLAHAPDPSALPAMIWSTNYGRLLSQTVYTLFFAGRDFAPYCILDEKNIQDYLQEHYIEAFGQLADRIRAYDDGSLFDECVIGWDSLNEPFEGLCGWEALSVNPIGQGSTLKKGTHPTPAQGLRLGMGQVQTVENWTFGPMGPAKDGSVTIDPQGRSIWSDPSTETPEGYHEKYGWRRDVSRWPLGTCVWANHGVWDVETGFILRDDYFRYSPTTGKEVEFIDDYWRPHFFAWAHRIRASHPEAILLVQPPVFALPPEIGEEILKGRAAYSPHYYDGLTLVTRHWNWFNADALGLLRGKYKNKMQAVKIGEPAIRKSLQEQLGMLKADVDILKTPTGDRYPVVIGEIGTPFDMDDKRSYGWTDGGKHKGDYSRQEKALDASLNGADGKNALNWTVWTYCTDHTHDWSDGWNMEDLSLYSPDDLRDDGRGQQGVSVPDLLEGPGAQFYDPCVGASRAGLLRNASFGPGAIRKGDDGATVHVSAAAASSAFSLSSFNLANSVALRSADEMTLRPPKPQPTLRDWFEDPFGFLTNGARAVRAFARPWPHKIVGLPADMKFDIGKAYFKLVVKVTSDDRPSAAALGLGGKCGDGGGGFAIDDDDEDGVDVPPTEIYVPLVHYASDDLAKKCRGLVEDDRRSVKSLRRLMNTSDVGAHRRSGSVEEQKSTTGGGGGGGGGGVMSAFSSALNIERGNQLGSRYASSMDLPTLNGGGVAAMAAAAGSNLDMSTSPTVEEGGSLPRDLVDLDVKVSAGRWEVEGQTLKWWYSVPREGEPPKEYTIEIRRRRGVIKVAGVGKNWWTSWCERICACLSM